MGLEFLEIIRIFVQNSRQWPTPIRKHIRNHNFQVREVSYGLAHLVKQDRGPFYTGPDTLRLQYLTAWLLCDVMSDCEVITVRKVMFLHLSVILFTGWGGLTETPPVWHPSPGSPPPLAPQQTATAADGTHPTGMHPLVFHLIY